MDILFKLAASTLLAFTVWIVWVFCKEWAPLYKNKEEDNEENI